MQGHPRVVAIIYFMVPSLPFSLNLFETHRLGSCDNILIVFDSSIFPKAVNPYLILSFASGGILPYDGKSPSPFPYLAQILNPEIILQQKCD